MSNLKYILDMLMEYEKKKLELIFSLFKESKIIRNFNPILLEPIDQLKLKKRTLNSLKLEKFEYIGDIVCNPCLRGKRYINGIFLKFKELLRIPNFGMKSLQEINEALIDKGINDFVNFPEYILERIEKYGKPFDKHSLFYFK